MKPTLGRVVFYTWFEQFSGKQKTNPARVVKVWSDTCVNLVVDLDGGNDHFSPMPGEQVQLQAWATSVMRVEKPEDVPAEPHCSGWSWPPRV